MIKKARGSSRNQLELPFAEKSPAYNIVTWTQKTLFQPEDPREIVSLAELAELTGFSKSKLLFWVERRQIPGGCQIAKGCKWQFHRRAIEAWWQTLSRPRT
jgi:predicted DNA-binding transcriptional regulator AlpA